MSNSNGFETELVILRKPKKNSDTAIVPLKHKAQDIYEQQKDIEDLILDTEITFNVKKSKKDSLAQEKVSQNNSHQETENSQEILQKVLQDNDEIIQPLQDEKDTLSDKTQSATVDSSILNIEDTPISELPTQDIPIPNHFELPAQDTPLDSLSTAQDVVEKEIINTTQQSLEQAPENAVAEQHSEKIEQNLEQDEEIVLIIRDDPEPVESQKENVAQENIPQDIENNSEENNNAQDIVLNIDDAPISELPSQDTPLDNLTSSELPSQDIPIPNHFELPTQDTPLDSDINPTSNNEPSNDKSLEKSDDNHQEISLNLDNREDEEIKIVINEDKGLFEDKNEDLEVVNNFVGDINELNEENDVNSSGIDVAKKKPWFPFSFKKKEKKIDDKKKKVENNILKLIDPQLVRDEIETKIFNMDTSNSIYAVGLKKRFGKKEAVKGVSFFINPGEVVGFLGPNGAGKTTSFYMVVGFIKPTEGKINLGPKDITLEPMFKRARSGIAYLPQEASVFRKLSVEDNVRSVLETRKDLTPIAKKEQLEYILNELSIADRRKQKAYTLSGGERRRTEIARALAINPKFLLLDEPFAGIDPIAVHEIKLIIEKLKSKNIGVLITDHNVRDTLEITDRSYIVKSGEVIIYGSKEEIVHNPIAKKVYLGENFKM